METLRVHYCLDKPRDDRRCRARCGHWTTHYTDDHALVTCKACRKLLPLPSTSKAPAMNKLSSILPLALILLAACGPLPADDLDGSTSSGDSTSGESTGSTGAESTGEGSTSEALDVSTGGESSTGEGSTSGGGGEGMGSGGVEACWANECGEDMPCGKNLACLPHPVNGAMVCAASNCDPSAPCAGITATCPVTVPQGVCIVNETNHGWCYPQVCVAVGDCAAGFDCINGYCY